MIIADPATANQLITSLTAAQQSAVRGDWTPAANQIGALINKVNAALNSRKITQATANLLISLATSIQTAYNAGHNP